MVHRGERLRGVDRMNQRHVHGGEDRHPPGQRRQPRRPGERLERPFARFGQPAEAGPARDRQEELEAAFVGDFRRRDVVGPRRLPPLRHGGQREPAVGVGGEDAELEFFRAEEGIGHSASSLAARRLNPSSLK